MTLSSNPPASFDCRDTSSRSQRARVLATLIEAGSEGRTTVQLRRDLDVMQPAARVKELTERGYIIDSKRVTAETKAGHEHHNVARYTYMGKKPADGGAK